MVKAAIAFVVFAIDDTFDFLNSVSEIFSGWANMGKIVIDLGKNLSVAIMINFSSMLVTGKFLTKIMAAKLDHGEIQLSNYVIVRIVMLMIYIRLSLISSKTNRS